MPALPVIEESWRSLPEPSSPSSVRRAGSAAFTLIEMLVGMGVLVLLVVLLSRILSQTSGIWSSGEANKERLQNVRVVTDLLGNELRAALLPINRSDQKNLQFVLNPTSLSGDFRNRDALFWQAPIAPDSSLGDVAVVGYFVRWDTTSSGNPKAQLCRFFVASVMKGNTASYYRIYSHPDDWVNDDLLQAVAPADKAHAYEGLFAENVVGLWFRCLDAAGEPITSDAAGASLDGQFDSRRGYTDSHGDVHTGGVLPPVVEVSLAMLDTQSAARVTQAQMSTLQSLVNGNGDAGTFLDAVMQEPTLKGIKSNIQAYQTKIYLQNAK